MDSLIYLKDYLLPLFDYVVLRMIQKNDSALIEPGHLFQNPGMGFLDRLVQIVQFLEIHF